ncbi:MAG: GNAT family N-acetyltransferase [Planctomycetaceae bacterium]
MGIHVSPANGEKKIRALRILFHDLLPEEQEEQIEAVLEAESRDELNLEGLYLAEEAGEDVGACLTLIQKDQSSFIWPPVIPEAAAWERVGSTLLRQIEETQKKQGILFTQAMLDPEARDEQSLLKKNNFKPLAELHFMECPIAQQDFTEPKLKNRAACRVVSFAESDNESLFSSILEKTYQETLDVPEFNLLRSGEDSLSSHRLNGPFEPELWFLFYVEDEPAGLILLRNYAADQKWEVAYMGVIPAFRGVGLGTFMLQESINRARDAGQQAIFLAVDSRNHYAIEIYQSLGFRQTSVKQVFIRQ